MGVSTQNQYDSHAMKAPSGADTEKDNGRLKNFRIPQDVFRHKGGTHMEKHKMIFEAINVIVAYQLECGFPLFDAYSTLE